MKEQQCIFNGYLARIWNYILFNWIEREPFSACVQLNRLHLRWLLSNLYFHQQLVSKVSSTVSWLRVSFDWILSEVNQTISTIECKCVSDLDNLADECKSGIRQKVGNSSLDKANDDASPGATLFQKLLMTTECVLCASMWNGISFGNRFEKTWCTCVAIVWMMHAKDILSPLCTHICAHYRFKRILVPSNCGLETAASVQ